MERAVFPLSKREGIKIKVREKMLPSVRRISLQKD
jgi:hypothetical protein|tara:strand:+ start:2764 stop:2868 length:105 start_codon:yes stop_codon:yes gene_type:complete